MTKSLKYTWPVFVAIVLLIYSALLGSGYVSALLVLKDIPTLFFTIAAIYYLYTSPFGQTQFLALATLIFIRFLIPIMVPFKLITGISFYMGSNVFILFYYCIRTLQKEPILRLDYTKLFLVGGFIFLQIAYYGGLIHIDNTAIDDLDYTKGDYLAALGYINTISRFLGYGLVLVHLRHIGKWEKDQLDQNEMELIDKIGEEE